VDAQRWLAINGMTCEDTSGACNWVASGINLADDQSSYRAAVRFGILMNNENNIATANDAIGFGKNFFRHTFVDPGFLRGQVFPTICTSSDD